jgi:ornithine carbamoyltransferase
MSDDTGAPMPLRDSDSAGERAPGYDRVVTRDPAIRSLLNLGTTSAATLRELRGRAYALRRGEHHAIRTVAPIALLLGEPVPYVRAAIEAGAALLGLRIVTYGPDEVARLGEPGVAGERLGALHPALLGAGLPAAVLSAMAERAGVPVIEAGGPGGDPAGALADLFVLERALGGLEGRKLAWVGDASGLLHDLLVAGTTLGLSVSVAHPVGFAPDVERVTWARERAGLTRAAVHVTTELAEALQDAHAIYAEPWPEGGAERFRGYSVQRHAVRGARGGCVFLHRAPERRGPELSASFTEDAGWLALEQARTRAYSWAAVLGFLLQPDPLRSVLMGAP